ncbi:hypothetical protein [Curtobacterium sp. MCBA15_001]|uniref:hypothetical protein n=1 Tax=Curtobacterium sp. MCBA15_001 TaxID=1898731 RepID=UPI001113D89A|nr:hypothetical protein [Curtobacterium sp. MCBA15_001]
MNDLPRADAPAPQDHEPVRTDAGWGSTPTGPSDRYGTAAPAAPSAWYGTGAPAGPSAWNGAAGPAGPQAAPQAGPPAGPYAGPPAWSTWSGAPTQRTTKPRPPWFWPVVAVAVGVAAVLTGGGVGFAIGHAIGSHQSQSTPQFPGGTNRFPGQGGGTERFPGSSGQDG